MAEVLLATAVGEDGFERRVAIKRMLEGGSSDPSFVRMFLDEARIASRLHHGNIVGLLDYGVVEGMPFHVLELVDGENAASLAHLGAEHDAPMPVEVALHLCVEVAHALDYAHRARDPSGRALGIVHRDVKPANVLVSWEGDVKLGDFGIALAHDRAEQTEDGVAKGTLAYMAPEQALHRDVGPRTDVFALGCVLHALVAGESPVTRSGGLAAVL